MAETWAKGLDLHVDLSGSRVRVPLEAGLRDAISSGRLRPGTRLPSSRALAEDLGVARNTVAEVYGQMVAEGWLTARTGAGTVVAPRAIGRGTHPAEPVAVAPPRYDLRSGEPDLASFPRREWLAAARRGLADAPDHLLGYGDPRGVPALRAALADYLARARGVHADAGRIVICSGFAHALAVVCRALRATGCDVLAVEEYGHQLHRDIVAGQGLSLRLLPVDESGAVISALGDADAMLVTPAHQFPLGMALSPARRLAGAAWGGIVIEDDYDGEFRYDRQPVGAMQALAPDRVIYAGTASKSLAPGVQLAWLAVPPRLLDPVVAAMSGAPSAVDQLTLAAFITGGTYDRHIRRVRLAYRRRRDSLMAAVDGLGLHLSGIAAGLHANLELELHELEALATARAAHHGVAITGLSDFIAEGASERRAGLVVGYGRPPAHAYTTALARLTAVLSSLRHVRPVTGAPG
jgi:GntR family transcriptional regulator / MocR family aminotransferase